MCHLNHCKVHHPAAYLAKPKLCPHYTLTPHFPSLPQPLATTTHFLCLWVRLPWGPPVSGTTDYLSFLTGSFHVAQCPQGSSAL